MDLESNPALEHTERKRLWGRLAIRVGLIVAIALILVFVVPPLASTLFPFAASLVVAWMLHPLIQKIRSKVRIPNRLLSFIFVFLIILLAVGVITLFFYYIVNEVKALVSSWTSDGGNLSSILSSENLLSGILGALPDSISESIQYVLHQIMEWINISMSGIISGITAWVRDVIMQIPSFFISLVVFIMSSYFITADYSNIRLSITKHFKGALKDFFSLLKSETTSATGRYLKAQLILSGCVFVILLVGFIIPGQKYALILALLFAVLDFIPLIGSGTVMVPWAGIALITGNYPLAIQLMVIWGVVVLFRRVFEPKIIGSQTGLSPLLSLMSIFIGMRVYGVLGMVLGPIVLQVTIKVFQSGLFKGLLYDLKLLTRDCVALLRDQPESKTGQ